jgi:hypothetical protein
MNRATFLRIGAKVLALFVAINVLFALVNPVPALGRVSIYNTLVPGRERLPYGDVPGKAYNLSLYDLNAMFAAHAINMNGGAKPAEEFRVVLIGDSSTWGWFLKNEDTLAGLLNAQQLRADGKRTRVYNLGYPIMSLTKDLLILDHAMRYQPDMIVWLVTLESFPANKQLTHPIVQNNADTVRRLIVNHHLVANPNDSSLASRTFIDRTLVGQRRAVADWLRLQTYGVMWGATGIDQYYPEQYEPAQRDLEADEKFKELKPPILRKDDLAFDVLAAGIKIADSANVPIVILNEPILISQGQNSDVRYNFFYPRWAYDQYRTLLREHLAMDGIRFLDMWDAVPQQEFTNSAVHLTPAGSRLLAERIGPTLQGIIVP